MSAKDETNTDKNLLEFCGDQKFTTIYADPPWRFQNRTGKVAPEHKRLNRYKTMTLDDIKKMPVSQIAADHEEVVAQHLPTGKLWGFRY